MTHTLTRLTSAWRVHLPVDLLAAAIAGVAVSRTERVAGIDAGSFYQLCAGAAVGLTAFVVAPVGILLALGTGGRFMAFDRAQRPTIMRAMAWAFAMSVALLATSVVGAAIDPPGRPLLWLRETAVGLSTASLLAAVHLFWFFFAGLAVRHLDETDPMVRVRGDERVSP